MRIGIDARELCGRATGVGRYLGGLLSEWANDGAIRHHDFVLFAPEALPLSLDARRFTTRIVAGHGGTRWEQLDLAKSLRAEHLDVFFSPAYTAPLFIRTPLVVAMHDLSFVAHPEWFSTREGMRRRFLARRAALAARAVITISLFSRRELVERFGLPDSRVHVIPPGITSPATASPPDGRSAPRVLYAGSIFARRHVPDLIRAFGPIARAHPDARLDIAGDDRSHPRQDVSGAIQAEGLEGQIRWLQYVSDEELGTLYASARAFAFLSEYEGLGLTPLEALAAGVPPVLLDTEVARESCGAAAMYVPQGDLAATTQALDRVLFDGSVRASLLSAAPPVLAQYSWRRAARQTLSVLEQAAGSAASPSADALSHS
jgi:glycosyltransferase involved in cell wall biosynthesis